MTVPGAKIPRIRTPHTIAVPFRMEGVKFSVSMGKILL